MKSLFDSNNFKIKLTDVILLFWSFLVEHLVSMEQSKSLNK